MDVDIEGKDELSDNIYHKTPPKCQLTSRDVMERKKSMILNEKLCKVCDITYIILTFFRKNNKLFDIIF